MRPSHRVLEGIIKHILSAEVLDSRALGFLSFMVESHNISHFYPTQTLLQNRLGWLLEVSGKKASFDPLETERLPLLELSLQVKNDSVKKYLQGTITPAGKHWHLWDCPLDDIKGSFVDGMLRKTGNDPVL